MIGTWELLLYVGYLLGFGWLTGLLQAFLLRARLIRPALVTSFYRMGLVTVALLTVGLLALVVGGQSWLFRALYQSGPPPGWYFFLVFLLTQWPGLFLEQILSLQEKPRWLALFGGGSALGMLLALLCPLYLGYPLEIALQALAAFAAVKGIALLAWWWSERLTRPAVSLAWSQLSPWLTTAWPLIAYASVGALVTAFDPWFVNFWFAGDEEVFALFRYGARELPLLAAVTNGAMVVVLPRLAEAPAAGLDLLRSSSRRLMHWIFGTAIGLMLTAPWWWTGVFTSVFAESLPLFQVYLFVVASRLLFPVPVLTARGHTRMLPFFGLLELLLNALLSWWLASYWGLTGILWATVLAYWLDKLALMAYLYYRTGIRPERYTDLRWYGGYLCALGIAWWLASSGTA